jgi:hypothetical protein
MTVLDDLDRYYRSRGIAAEHFTCAHQDDCTPATGPKEAFVGEHYGAEGIPRLLFLSLDPGETGATKEPERRTLAFQQADTPKWTEGKPLHRGRHWSRTLELAELLLRRWIAPLALPPHGIVRYIAHTNSAKCSEDNLHRRTAGPTLFKNCRGHIQGELEVLGPQILVSQGQWAWDVVRALPIVETIIEREIEPEARCVIRRATIVNGAQTLLLRTSHPGNRRRFAKERSRVWPVYQRAVEAFVAGTRLSEIDLLADPLAEP